MLLIYQVISTHYCPVIFSCTILLKHLCRYLFQHFSLCFILCLVTNNCHTVLTFYRVLPHNLFSQIVKLQRVQNTCARLICNLPKFAHVTPLLRELHWLPIRQRIEFKMLMIVYKALNGQAPSYIIELLSFKFQTDGHNLRSTQDTLALQIPQIRTKVTLGDRSFFVCSS